MLIDDEISTTVYSPPQQPSRFKKTTDVQQTWKEHGWASPSDDPLVKAKWQYYRTLNALMERSDV